MQLSILALARLFTCGKLYQCTHLLVLLILYPLLRNTSYLLSETVQVLFRARNEV